MIRIKPDWFFNFAHATAALATGLLVLTSSLSVTPPIYSAEALVTPIAAPDVRSTAALQMAQESITSALQQGVCVGDSRIKIVISKAVVGVSWGMSL